MSAYPRNFSSLPPVTAAYYRALLANLLARGNNIIATAIAIAAAHNSGHLPTHARRGTPIHRTASIIAKRYRLHR